MPRIKASAIPVDLLRQATPRILDDLQRLLECPAEYFSVEISGTTSILDDPAPFVEVAWFDRGQAIQDEAAAVITRYLKAVGCPAPDVCFLRLERSAYYEDGIHF